MITTGQIWWIHDSLISGKTVYVHIGHNGKYYVTQKAHDIYGTPLAFIVKPKKK